MSLSSKIWSRREFLRTSALAAGTVGATSSLLKAQAEPFPSGHRVPVIDCHCHVGIGNQMYHESTSLADPEEHIRHMSEAGIDQAAIFPIEDTYFAPQNRMIAYYTYIRYPGRFIGFAKHAADREKGMIHDQLIHEVRVLGLRGLKLHPPGPSQEIMEAVVELGIPIIYHPYKTADLVPWARDYPKVNFILAHLGASPYSKRPEAHLEGIAAAKQYANIYLDTSTVLETSYLERAAKELPPNKLVYGSDAPDCDTRLEIFKIRMQNLPKQQEELILGGNYLEYLDNQGKNHQWENHRWKTDEWRDEKWDLWKTDEGKDYSSVGRSLKTEEDPT